MFLLTPFGGVFADRIDRRTLMLITQPSAMLFVLVMAILVSTGVVQFWHVLVLSALSGVVMAFDMPARQALVPSLVPREDLMNSIALYNSAFSGTRIWGPTLAGLLILPIGLGGCFYVATAGYAGIIVCLLFLNVPAMAATARQSSVRRNLVDGFSYMRGIRTILLVMILVAVFSLFATAHRALMPIFAEDVLGAGAAGLGWLMGASGVGALIAGLWVASLREFSHKGWLLLGSSVARGAFLTWFALSKSLYLSLTAVFFAGMAESVNMTMMNTTLQLLSSDEMRGRVMGAFALTSSAMMPLASLQGGALADAIGAPYAISLGGLICILSSLAMMIFSSSLRRYA